MSLLPKQWQEYWKEESNVVKLWAARVRSGLSVIDDVPARWKGAVEAELAE